MFLAGSIEMGNCEDWQVKVFEEFPKGVTFLNPRRDDFDTSQEQVKENPYIRGQIQWELDNIKGADIVFLYLDPATKSPISLLEMGICLERKANLIVVCPPGFYRKANIDITCEDYNTPVFESLDEGIKWLREYINYRLTTKD